MEKPKIIGLLLIVSSIVVIYASSLQFQSGFSGSNIFALSLKPGGTAYAQFNVSNGTIVGTIYYTNNSKIDYLIVNSLGFIYLYNNALSQSRVAYAESNGGVVESLINASAGMFPYSGNTSSSVYVRDNSTSFPPGAYYQVFHNPGNANVMVYYSAILRPQSSASNMIFSSSIFGIIAALMFVSGILIIIYSIFLNKGNPNASSENEISSLYDMEERKTRKRRKRKTNKK